MANKIKTKQRKHFSLHFVSIFIANTMTEMLFIQVKYHNNIHVKKKPANNPRHLVHIVNVFNLNKWFLIYAIHHRKWIAIFLLASFEMNLLLNAFVFSSAFSHCSYIYIVNVCVILRFRFAGNKIWKRIAFGWILIKSNSLWDSEQVKWSHNVLCVTAQKTTEQFTSIHCVTMRWLFLFQPEFSGWRNLSEVKLPTEKKEIQPNRQQKS